MTKKSPPARYFDFRSMDDLKGKAKRWLGATNPFSPLPAADIAYIDCLATVRNCVVHGSEASVSAYKRSIKSVYGMKKASEPTEFLHAKDYRPASPPRDKSRLHGLVEVIVKAIQST